MLEIARTKQVSRATFSQLFPELYSDVAANEMYLSEDSLKVLARIAFDNKFANADAKAHQLARGDDVDGTESQNPIGQALSVVPIESAIRNDGNYRLFSKYLLTEATKTMSSNSTRAT